MHAPSPLLQWILRKKTISEDFFIATNLHKVFNDNMAVNGVSFSIRKGEIFGLLGSNRVAADSYHVFR